ncbi:MAG: hypothetical protein WA726_11680 [Acidimicrobiia bacterium]
MRPLGVAALLGLTTVACHVSGEAVPTHPTITAVAATTTDPATTTTVGVDPALVFEDVDRGVASHIEFLDPELPFRTPPADFDPEGEQFDMVGCRTTWFGNYEFEFEWAPAATSSSNGTTRQIAVVFAIGDTGSNGVVFEVNLSRPGRFVVPVEGFDPFGTPDDVFVDGRIIDDASSFFCVPVYIGAPIVEPADAWESLTVDLEPPLAIHPAGSIQGIIERMDPSDVESTLRPLAALAGATSPFPTDVVYVVPERVMTSIRYETDGGCTVLTSNYGETSTITQHAGCFNGRYEGIPIDDTWTIDVTGDAGVSQLVPLYWVGHPAMNTPQSPAEYLDRRQLPEGATEVLRTDIHGTLVSVIRYLQTDGIVEYVLEGLGDNSGGGGFPGEIWQGCYQVEWKETGYSMIVVGNPDWTVNALEGAVALETVDGVGVAVVPFIVRQRDELHIQDQSGNTPDCVNGP